MEPKPLNRCVNILESRDGFVLETQALPKDAEVTRHYRNNTFKAILALLMLMTLNLKPILKAWHLTDGILSSQSTTLPIMHHCSSLRPTVQIIEIDSRQIQKFSTQWMQRMRRLCLIAQMQKMKITQDGNRLLLPKIVVDHLF